MSAIPTVDGMVRRVREYWGVGPYYQLNVMSIRGTYSSGLASTAVVNSLKTMTGFGDSRPEPDLLWLAGEIPAKIRPRTCSGDDLARGVCPREGLLLRQEQERVSSPPALSTTRRAVGPVF